ncbi:MAG: HD domain-containing protein [Oscillospiraceae bacterium]|nr:HD domain-containing protein [Oscillospiraceae bacterium]
MFWNGEAAAFPRGGNDRLQRQRPSPDPAFLKVYGFSRLIGHAEGLEPGLQFTLEAAALVHDIGIRPAEEKYGSCEGPLQEKEGILPAREMLSRLGFDPAVTGRVCRLVGQHHTYHPMDGADHQILVEADFLVNLFENASPDAAVSSALQKIFRTETGKQICRVMFGTGSGVC